MRDKIAEIINENYNWDSGVFRIEIYDIANQILSIPKSLGVESYSEFLKKEKKTMTSDFNTLWHDCLYELYAKAVKENKPWVEFSDVDKLVVEKSKVIVEWKEKG
jgi:hypothetical protein